jgi:hypothetical protein
MALVPVTTAGACHKYEPEGYGSRDDNEPEPHGSTVADITRERPTLGFDMVRPHLPVTVQTIESFTGLSSSNTRIYGTG